MRRATYYLLTLLVVAATARPAAAAEVEASGAVQGADVDGTISLRLDPAGGSIGGTIEMTVRFDCGGKIRNERHVLELRGRVSGDQIRGTAIYLEREGLPKDELSRCKSAYETYSTRKDSRAFIGSVDAAGARASGTLGEYRPTVTWQASWTAPPSEPAPPEAPPAEAPVDQAPENEVAPVDQ